MFQGFKVQEMEPKTFFKKEIVFFYFFKPIYDFMKPKSHERTPFQQIIN